VRVAKGRKGTHVIRSMDWGQVLTIIFGTAGFMGIFVLLINRQIDMVNKRIDSLEKRFDDVNRRLDKIEEDIKDFKREVNERLNRMEEILYKALGAEAKKGD